MAPSPSMLLAAAFVLVFATPMIAECPTSVDQYCEAPCGGCGCSLYVDDAEPVDSGDGYIEYGSGTCISGGDLEPGCWSPRTIVDCETGDMYSYWVNLDESEEGSG